MSRTPLALATVLAALLCAPGARAQQVSKDAAPRARAPLCAAGVRKYERWADVPAPFDSVRLPRGEPIRVTSPEEAEAAERQLLERAGRAGATGIVVVDESSETGGGMEVRRSVTGVFVRADSARAYRACTK